MKHIRLFVIALALVAVFCVMFLITNTHANQVMLEPIMLRQIPALDQPGYKYSQDVQGRFTIVWTRRDTNSERFCLWIEGPTRAVPTFLECRNSVLDTNQYSTPVPTSHDYAMRNGDKIRIEERTLNDFTLFIHEYIPVFVLYFPLGAA